MKWFHDLPIARKLALGFTLTTLMTLVLGVRPAAPQRGQRAAARDGRQRHPFGPAPGEARSQLGEFRTYELALLSMLDQPDKVADYTKRMDDTAKGVHDELAACRAAGAGQASVNCIAPPARSGSLFRRQQSHARSRGRGRWRAGTADLRRAVAPGPA